MSKNLSRRIAGGLEDADEDDLLKIMDWIRDGWKDYSDGARRSVTYAILLIGVFELLSSASLEKITLGPFEFTNSPIIRAALPPLIAYLALDTVLLTNQALRRSAAFSSVFALWSAEAKAEGLERLMKPREPSFWSITGITRDANRTHGEHFEGLLTLVLALLLACVFLGFEVHAYYLLFHAAKVSRWTAWLSLLPTVLFMSALGWAVSLSD